MKVSGFVLAGGKSSRMGRDKALLEFRGVPMVRLAVERLREICDEVGILGNDPGLAEFGEVTPDAVVDCGPLSGLVEALRVARHEWVLVTPVDVPLLPEGLLRAWVGTLERDSPAVCCLADRGQPQPLVCLLNRAVKPLLEDALRDGERKVLTLLRRAGEAAGGFRMMDVEEGWGREVWTPTQREAAAREFWFGNANTPAELAELEGVGGV